MNDRVKFILMKAGPAPEGATHYDPNYPEFLKLVGKNEWWYWCTEGGSCVGYKGHWEQEPEANCSNFTTVDYIKLENSNGD